MAILCSSLLYRDNLFFSLLLYSEHSFEVCSDRPFLGSTLEGSHFKVFQDKFSMLTRRF